MLIVNEEHVCLYIIYLKLNIDNLVMIKPSTIIYSWYVRSQTEQKKIHVKILFQIEKMACHSYVEGKYLFSGLNWTGLMMPINCCCGSSL